MQQKLYMILKVHYSSLNVSPPYLASSYVYYIIIIIILYSPLFF